MSTPIFESVRACVRAGRVGGVLIRATLSDLLTGVKGPDSCEKFGPPMAPLPRKWIGRIFFSIVSEERNRSCGTSGRGLARIGGGRRRIDIRVVHRARVSNRARDRALSSGTAAGRNPGAFEPRDG